LDIVETDQADVPGDGESHAPHGAHGANRGEVVVADHRGGTGPTGEEIRHRLLATSHAAIALGDSHARGIDTRTPQSVTYPRQARRRSGVRRGGGDVANPAVTQANQVLRRKPSAAAIVAGDGRKARAR